MAVTVFRGTFVHSRSADHPLEILDNYAVGVEASKIIFVEPACKVPELAIQHGFAIQDIRDVQRKFFMPGFVDTHIHAPQYVFTGTAMGLPLLQWLQKYTFPTEAKFADLNFATDAYQRVVRRTLKNGTTTASYFATIHKESSLQLAKIAAVLGQRAFVGKVNMDTNSPDYYVETTEGSLEDTEWFIQQVKDLNSPLVTPIITPRFAISCSVELMQKLAGLAQKYDLPIQTHLSENSEEIAFVRKEFPRCSSYTDVYRHCGLMTQRSVFAHCIYLDDEEMELIRSHGAGIAHCASSNFSLKSGVMDLKKLWQRHLKLGLGTDVSGGYSPSILSSIRQAVMASNVQEIDQRGGYRAVDHRQMFYLATLGGSQVLGLQDQIGNFQVGKDFDAILVDPEVEGGPFDVFDSQYEDSTEDVVQKFLFLGDDRNIREVYVAGRRVVPQDQTLPQSLETEIYG